MTPQFTTALIVDDDALLLRSLELLLQPRTQVLWTCKSAGEAISSLEKHAPELVVLDLSLPDGDAFDVVEVLDRLSPQPKVIIISGAATPEDTFRLAQLGARCFLSKPFGVQEFERALQTASELQLHLGPALCTQVGVRSLRDIESEVRATLLREALARSSDSRRGAGRLLQVSRQMVQHMLRNLERS